MAVPKKKQSPSRSGMRRSHDALKPSAYVIDKNTGIAKRNHHVGMDGNYKGVQVVQIKTKDSEEEQ